MAITVYKQKTTKNNSKKYNPKKIIEKKKITKKNNARPAQMKTNHQTFDT